MKRLSLFLSLFLLTLCLNATAAKLTDTAMNQAAPDFKLKDINGKTVSLADFKGKTLVIDFWATWCEPCRNSFPAAKMVVEKYKNDPNVKFLFIDTRETDANYQELAKKFMADNQYPFYIVFDEKSDDDKMDATYRKYVMPGIPTKYFIDGNGIIKYKSIGYVPDQTKEQTAADIEDLIEKVKAGK